MAQKKQVQAIYLWEGLDRRGNRAKGEIEATSLEHAKARLRQMGNNPLKVKAKPKPLFGGGGKSINSRDIAIFSRQLATMISSGVPLVQAFEIIGRGHEKMRMREMLLAVKTDVEGGMSLANSLRKHPMQFDDLTCNLVHAGEQAGILESLLDKIAVYKEKTEQIKGKIKKAMFYPVAVLVVAFIITAILLIFVIPQFADMFKGFGADLPALTKMVVSLSDIFIQWWWAIFGGIALLVWGLIQMKKRSSAFNEGLQRLSLKLPVIGNILHKAAIARYSRTLSTMFAAGVPLVEAMDSVAGAVGNVIYGKAVLQIRDEVSTGQALNLAMTDAGVFPNMVCQMVAIGEEAGSIDTMLSKVADFYEEEVDNAVDAMSSLMEPLIMAFLGVIIGGLVVAMYLPIFKMASVV